MFSVVLCFHNNSRYSHQWITNNSSISHKCWDPLWCRMWCLNLKIFNRCQWILCLCLHPYKEVFMHHNKILGVTVHHKKKIYLNVKKMMIQLAVFSNLKAKKLHWILLAFKKLKKLPSTWKHIIMIIPVQDHSNIDILKINFIQLIFSICLNPLKIRKIKPNSLHLAS